MHGKHIDRAVAFGLGAAAAYLLFLNAGFGIPASCVLAFACVCLARYIIAHRPRRFAAGQAQAGAALEAISRMDMSQAELALHAILGESLAEKPARLTPVLRHAAARLTADDVLGIWRANRGCERIVIAATCAADAEARAYAETLSRPEIGLCDRSRLLAAVRRTGLFVPPDAPRLPLMRRLRAIGGRLSARPARPRMFLYGLSLLGLYMTSGRAIYLFASMLTLFHAGASWIRNGIRI